MERLQHDLSHRFEADSVGRTLALVGEKWTMLILREAFFGVRRYGQLVRNLGIPRPTLSARLRRLVDAGLLERVRYATEPDRYEYRLTRAGIECSHRSSASCAGVTRTSPAPKERRSCSATMTAARSPTRISRAEAAAVRSMPVTSRPSPALGSATTMAESASLLRTLTGAGAGIASPVRRLAHRMVLNSPVGPSCEGSEPSRPIRGTPKRPGTRWSA
jgi:DNA-binding HxlR family transcriptional regulator